MAEGEVMRRAPARRKSLVGPTIVTALCLLLLLGLGTWQIERLHWKEGLISERHAGMVAPPVPLPATLAAARSLAFRHVRLSGTFLNDHEFYLYTTTADGAVGYDVVTPLKREDGSIVLVNRGFVPEDRKAPSTRAAGELAGKVTIMGVLRMPSAGKPGWFVPDNRPDRNEWFYVDIPAMAAAGHLAPALPFYVDADATPNPGGYPSGGQTRIELPNHHLQYAITWYALAAGLVAVYIALVRRRRAGEQT
jgi:surfeit locus 1 family protein